MTKRIHNCLQTGWLQFDVVVEIYKEQNSRWIKKNAMPEIFSLTKWNIFYQ